MLLTVIVLCSVSTSLATYTHTWPYSLYYGPYGHYRSAVYTNGAAIVKGVPAVKAIVTKGVSMIKGLPMTKGVPLMKGMHTVKGVPLVKGVLPMIKDFSMVKGVPVVKGFPTAKGYSLKGGHNQAGLYYAHHWLQRSHCHLPKESGPCMAAFPRWHFDTLDGQCKEFVYGGCGKNGNNFFTKALCEASCHKEVALCSRPRNPGPCLEAHPKYYFNILMKKCMMFLYSGCGDNGNNFETKEECEETCPNPPPVCERPKQKGPCFMVLPKWYYNQESESCEMFIYGGCMSNGNKFDTKDKCFESCGKRDEAKEKGDTGN